MLFRKKKEKILAPVCGEVISLAEVNDPVFSQGLMGEGCAIKPITACKTICAPVTGTLIVLPESRHAFGIRTKNGDEYLIHIGIDTVNLHGEGFETDKKEGEQVKAGDIVITLHKELFEKGCDLTTMVICTSLKNEEITDIHFGKIQQGELLFQV